MENSDNEEEKIDESGNSITPFDSQKIKITIEQKSLDLLIKRIQYDEIKFFSEYQRLPDLWDDGKKSRLIESILLRLPIPSFYFDGTDDDTWFIIDGLQRLSTIRHFVLGITHNEDGTLKKDNFLRLKDLDYLKVLEGKTYVELERPLQRRIEEFNVTIHILDKETPSEVKYNIFKRLNTGGIFLESQEIRHALNQGIPASFLQELSQLAIFKETISQHITTKRMKEREYINRFIAFYLIYDNSLDEYDNKLSIDSFLNEAMGKIRRLPEKDRNILKERFEKSLKLAKNIFENPFRKLTNDKRKNPINKALFDAISVVFAYLTDTEVTKLTQKKELFLANFMILMNLPFFEKSITEATSVKKAVNNRFLNFRILVKNTIYDKPIDFKEF